MLKEGFELKKISIYEDTGSFTITNWGDGIIIT
jgi:hypothetical protein